jgi:2'-5' RNA ligase
MSQLPTQMENHWWQRPGRRPGRELYHWHMLFHDQPRVRELAALAQERLVDLSGLDMVPMRWLHLTTYITGFVDEVSDGGIEAMSAEARRLLAGIAPIPVSLGRVLYHPQAIALAVEPLGALDPALDAVRAATRSAGCEGHTDTDPWFPHISVAYSNRSGPAAPIIAALGRWLPKVGVSIRSVSLVAQTQVGRTWQWRPVAEVPFTGQAVRPWGTPLNSKPL